MYMYMLFLNIKMVQIGVNPFDDTQGKKELTDAEYQKMVDELKETILKELNK